MFEEELENLPDQLVETYDKYRDPNYRLNTLRCSWLTFDSFRVLDSNSPIDTMLEEVDVMLSEADEIGQLLKGTSAISRLPLLDKLHRVTALMKSYRSKVQETASNLNRDLSANSKPLYQDLEKSIQRLNHVEFSLPITVNTVDQLDVIITKFKLEYDNFNEIYEKMLLNDYDEFSNMSRVDHISMANSLMEKYNQIIEAQEDSKQLLRRLRTSKYTSAGSSFLKDIYEDIQPTVICKELDDIFNR